MKLSDENDGETGADSEDEIVVTGKKRKLQVIEDDIVVNTVVPVVAKDSHMQGDEVDQNFNENSALYNSDIFDAENSDDASPVKDEENVKEITYSENATEENTVSPKHKRKKQKKDEKDCSRGEGRRTKKEKDKELFDIFSENQRLLRQSSVNLPYHQPPKRTLKEFLSERRKSVMSLKLKGHQTDPQLISYLATLKKMEPVKAVENPQTKCVRTGENLPEGVSSTRDEMSRTVPDLSDISHKTGNFSSEQGDYNISSEYIVNLESDVSNPKEDFTDRTDSNAVTEKISSETVLTNSRTENISDPVSGDVLPNGAEVVKSLTNGSFAPSELADLQTHTVQEKDMVLHEAGTLRDVMLINHINDIHEENAVSCFMSGVDLKQNDAKNNSHLKNDITINSGNAGLGNADMEQNARVETLYNATENDNCVQELSFKNKILCDKVELPAISSFKPRITGAPNTFINLGDSDDEKSPDVMEKKKELECFMEKFINHKKTLYRKPCVQEVNLNIVSRDPEKEGALCHTTLKVSVNSPGKEDTTLKPPGAKLIALKEQLFSEIAKKREAAVKKWQELDALDNEEELHEGEEDAELSEESEADDDEEEEEKSEVENSADDETNESERIRNPFLDDEASESNDDISVPHLSFTSKQISASEGKVEEGCALKKGCVSDIKVNEDVPSKEGSVVNSRSDERTDAAGPGEDSCSLRLFLESDSDEEITEVPVREQSFDLTGSTIPPYQPYGGFGPDKVSPTQNELKAMDTTHSTQSSEMSLSRTPASQLDGSQQLWPTQESPKSFQLFRNKQDSTCADLLCLMDRKGSQAVPDDILDVCSGNFTGSLVLPPTGSPTPVKESGVLLEGSPTDSHMKAELLALCSGKFTGSSVPGSVKPSSVTEEDLEDPLSESSLTESAKVRFRPKVLNISDDEDNEQKEVSDDEDNEQNEVSDDEENKQNEVLDGDNDDEHKANSISGMGSVPDEDLDALSDEELFVDNKVKKVSDFLEDEAELSGSDIGSDENEEDPDNDHYEEDVPDEELPSDEELRDQIGKVHFKNMMDEDKRELRLYQELFFEDGDLHSDGPGRQRKFTWRNIDGSLFSGGNDQNSESEDEDVQDDEKWRIERHQREKWLQEQEEKGGLHGETSPVKVAEKPSSIKIEIVNRVKESPAIVEDRKNDSRPLLFKQNESTANHRGSFLAKGQDFLTVLAKKLKNSDDDATGSRTTKHFVFRAVSPQKVLPKVEVKEKIIRTPVSRFNKNTEKKTAASSLNKSVFDFFST